MPIQIIVIVKYVKLNNKLLRILQWKFMDYPLEELYRNYNTLPLPALFKLQILKLMFLFTFYNNSLPSAFQNFFQVNNSVHDYYTRNSNALHLSLFNKNVGYKTIYYYGSKLWNELPAALKTFSSVSVFLNKVKVFYLSNEYFAK